MLKLADNLKLPIEAVTGTFAILAIRGVGKTHTASVMAEEMLKAGQPIVAYDPTGAWWGLKSSADGKRPAYPVVVFGGEHADVPLEETAGDTIAATIVDKRIPAILDCSLLRKGARIRLMTDFCESLYHRNREPLHFFADEVQTIAPQNIRAMPEATRLLGAVEDIILQGRRRGLGFTAISPRPAVVNTSVRSACQTLIAMRVIGKHDRKALDEWIEAHGDADTAKLMMDSLASLPKGEAWVWSPPEDIFKRVHFRARETFDSSATPKVGGKIVAPQKMAQIDLDALGAAIKATVEKMKADDPKALKAEIARLKAQKLGAAVDPAAIEKARVEGAKARDKEWEPILKARERLIDSLKGRMGKAERTAGELAALLHVNGEGPKTEIQRAPSISSAESGPRPARTLTDRRGTHVASSPTGGKPLSASGGVLENGPKAKGAGSRVESPALTESQLPARAQRFLDVAATLTTLGAEVTRETICGWLGVHPRGGSVGEVLKGLEEAGVIINDRGRITVTAEGQVQAGQINPGEAIERAKSGLTARQARFFEVICAAYPGDVSREDIATQFELHPRGGSLGEDLGRLVGRGLVDGNRGRYKAREFLFAGM